MENNEALMEEIKQLKKNQLLMFELYNNISQDLAKLSITNETLLCLFAHIYGIDKKVTYEIVHYLRERGFTVAQIATLLNCSSANIYSVIKRGSRKPKKSKDETSEDKE